jgi:RHS repeat-associated protein
MAGTLGMDNPFRHRGYINDDETVFYYLRSRYYYTAFRKFLNADVQLTGTKARLFDHNAFSYCRQNPVTFTDSDGLSPVEEAQLFFTNAAVVDGPYPAGDAIGLIGALFILAIGAVQSVFAPTISAIAISYSKEQTEAKTQTVTLIETTTADTLDPTGKVQYWEAYITPSNGIGVGAPLRFSAARNRILGGRDVLVKTQTAAITLIMGTGRNIGSEIDERSNKKGFYMFHYHIKRKNKGHIFFFLFHFNIIRLIEPRYEEELRLCHTT